MSQHHDLEPDEHGTRRPVQRGDERDPKHTGRPAPEAEPTLNIQRMAQQNAPNNRAVQRAVQRFLQRSSGGSATVPKPDEDAGQRIQSMSGGGTGIDPSAKGKLEE